MAMFAFELREHQSNYPALHPRARLCPWSAAGLIIGSARTAQAFFGAAKPSIQACCRWGMRQSSRAFENDVGRTNQARTQPLGLIRCFIGFYRGVWNREGLQPQLFSSR